MRRIKRAARCARPEPDAGAARDHSKESPSSSSQKSLSSSSSLSDELAATGIGRRTRFDVTRVNLDLEESPASSVRLRYEFRPQLVALGVLPRETRDPSPGGRPPAASRSSVRSRSDALKPCRLSFVSVRDRFRLRRRALHAPQALSPDPPRPPRGARKRPDRKTRLPRRHPALQGDGKDPPERPEGHRRPDRLPEHRLDPDSRADGLAERGRERASRGSPTSSST